MKGSKRNKRVSPYSKVARLKAMVEYLVQKFKPVCPFCNKVIGLDDLMQGHLLDSLTIHHLNENRADNRIANLILTHRGCHRRHHRIEELEEQGRRKS